MEKDIAGLCLDLGVRYVDEGSGGVGEERTVGET